MINVDVQWVNMICRYVKWEKGKVELGEVVCTGHPMACTGSFPKLYFVSFCPSDHIFTFIVVREGSIKCLSRTF